MWQKQGSDNIKNKTPSHQLVWHWLEGAYKSSNMWSAF